MSNLFSPVRFCHFRSFRRFSTFILLTVLVSVLNSQAQNFPPGFSQVKVADVYYPTSLAFAPDGRIFTTEKAGKVKIIKNGVMLSTLFLQVSVDQLNERGLSSICLDPNFNTNHFVYIYYTTASSPIHNRLSRFTANGDVAVPGSEVVILDFEPVVNSIHNSGGMVFGFDGTLYLAVGNDNVNSNSQDLTTYKGKILRINTDGSVPSGNPFTGSEPAKRIWDYGFRNPWTLSMQPGTGKIFANDVGEATWEEINDVTQGGKNYGWPGAEGMSNNPAYTNPVYTYHHGTGIDSGCAVTGGTFFNPSVTNYPSQYTGKYFYVDYCNKWINYLDLSSGVHKYNFATSLPGADNNIKVGPDGNLYYFSISQDALYKIIYSNNNAPQITSNPSNVSTPQGQPAAFAVSASGSNPLTYQWRKNGNDIPGANASIYTINSAQPGDAAQYSVKVTNTFGTAYSSNATLTVTAFNTKPVATINTPTSGTFYRNGDIIDFSGTGTDQEDGNLPASAFSWIIEFHHDQHYHPGPIIPAGVKSGSFSSVFGETSANVYWRLKLSVMDSKGLTDTTFVDIHPITAMLNLHSQPSGLQLLLEGQPHATPYSVLAVSGMARSLSENSPQTFNDSNYVFDHWSNGGNASQTIMTTDNPATYTAVFKSTGPITCSASGTITRDYWANVTGTTVSTVPVNTTPTSTSQLTIFEGPSNVADNYASRIRGYICPPTTGNYTFWIASDDNSELWLSTNDQPANKIKIASVPGYTASRQWTKYPSQQSTSIILTAGNKYYIEALHKEGTQGDNIAVGWQLPNSTLERPIPGSRLSPFTSSGGTGPVVSITSPANNSSFPTPVNINITANASSSGSSVSKVEFFQGVNKLGEDATSPYSWLWQNVTTGNYTLKAVATDANNAQGTSALVNIAVNTCNTPIITPSGPTTICSGSVTLNSNTGSGFIYQWKKDGVNINGATNSSFVATESGDYQVKIIQGSCIAWSAPTTVRIQNALSASITPGGPTSFCPGGNVVLYANTCSGYSYQWIKDGVNIPGANAATYTATIAGTYQLRVTQGIANSWSALLTITIKSCIGQEKNPDNGGQTESAKEPNDPLQNFEMKVYPNPSTGYFTISLHMPTQKQDKVKMMILNTLGQSVYSKEITSNGDDIKELVELDNFLPTGIYTLQVMVGDKIENTNMVLTR